MFQHAEILKLFVHDNALSVLNNMHLFNMQFIYPSMTGSATNYTLMPFNLI
jgi:hypothetical protein